MARKPMSEEQKQNLRDKALARAEAKRAKEQGDVQPAPAESPQEPETSEAAAPTSEQVEPSSVMLDEAHRIRESMHVIAQEHPDMIEASQAVDALDTAIARMGQVEGILASK